MTNPPPDFACHIAGYVLTPCMRVCCSARVSNVSHLFCYTVAACLEGSTHAAIPGLPGQLIEAQDSALAREEGAHRLVIVSRGKPSSSARHTHVWGLSGTVLHTFGACWDSW